MNNSSIKETMHKKLVEEMQHVCWDIETMLKAHCVHSGCDDIQVYVDRDMFDGEAEFTIKPGSDSVSFIWNYKKNTYRLQIKPINQQQIITEVYFTQQEDAIKAFCVWIVYYQSVVVENHKNY